MKRVRFMAAMCMVAMLGFTACGEGEKKEETAETTEAQEMDPHAGHDHGDMGHMEEGGNEGDGTPLEPMSFEEPAQEVQAVMSEVIKNYLDIQTSLAQDNAEGASHAAGPFVRMRNNVPAMDNAPSDQVDYLKKALGQASDQAVTINVTRDIDAQRRAFEDLSATIYALAKSFGSEQTLYYQYCPMAFDNKGAYWISAEEEIMNPYFGESMLKCGRVEETIEM